MASLGDAIHRPRLVERVFSADLRGHLAVQGPIMLDSGGFTTMIKNEGLRVSEVARIYEKAHADFFISLDVPATSNDRKRTRSRKYEETRTNLVQLLQFIDARKLVPVIHGTSVEEVISNCQGILEIHPSPTLVCVGGLVPLLRRSGRDVGDPNGAFAWVASVVSTVRDHFPMALIHVLGAGSPRTVAATIRCGADSTDSIAWRRAAGFGTIFLPGTSERFIEPRDRQRPNSRPTLSAKERDLLAECTCPACVEMINFDARIAELAGSYLARAAHNAFVILGEAKTASIT